jgi:hypothetical protein
MHCLSCGIRLHVAYPNLMCHTLHRQATIPRLRAARHTSSDKTSYGRMVGTRSES